YAVGLGIGDDLDQTGRVVGRHGTATGREREDTDVDFNAFALERLLGLAYPCDFRMGVDDRRDQVVVHLRLVAGDTLGNHHALFGRLVRQHRATHHVTDSVDAGNAGCALIVDEDEAALIHVHASIGRQQIGGDRTTANRDDQLVEGLLLLTFSGREADGHFLALDFGTGQARTQQNLQTLLGQYLEGFLGDLLIGSRQELVHRFDDGHFGTEACPDRTQFETDDTRADDAQASRNALEIQRTGGVDDDLLIDRRRRNIHRLGAGSQDDVLGGQRLGAAIELGDFHLLAGQQLAVAFENGHAIGLQQRRNAAGEVLNDLVLARDHGRHVHLDIAGANAMDVEALVGFVELVGAVEQRLGGDATHVQASAAQSGL